MTGVDELLAAASEAPGFEVARGTLRESGNSVALFIGGVPVPHRWTSGYVPAPDDNVLCVRLGQTWYVVGATQGSPDAPPPPRGTVTAAPTGSSTITISAGGTSYQAPFLGSYSPSVGHTVALLWTPGEDVPLVLGRPGSIPTPPPPRPDPTPPPSNPTRPPNETGRSRFTATDSRSRIPAGWSTNHGRHLTQGSWGSLSFTSGWFYGSRPRNALRGRYVTRVRIRLGARRRMGNYNQSITFTLRRHSHTSRPSGPINFLSGTVSVTVPSGGGARWVELPNSWGQYIIDNGGGIGLASGSYGGIVGVGAGAGLDPQSGLLEITWSRRDPTN